ncbi:protein Wnt-11b-1-like [Centruroides vittatus]|uniref:protein Wnt-11b-1-like n=1 Tax=Centruroides vittatus TaxID=120091 RepID=UPI00351016BD
MRFGNVYLFPLLFIGHITALQWLALAKSNLTWNKTIHCVQGRKLFGLRGRQIKICQRQLETMEHLVNAARSTMTVCQSTFSDRRWNCSSVTKAPEFPPDLTRGTREQAFLHALSSASVVHVTARGCSDGTLLSCGCGQVPHEPPLGDFKWGGCSDNTKYGLRFAKDFVDAPWNMRSSKKTILSEVNKHNHKAGRRAVGDNLRDQCKCHGVSGSCSIKTCWKALPSFIDVAERLKRKYHVAYEVTSSLVGTRRKLVPTNKQLGMFRADDLIYITKSPDYCLPDHKLGSYGTRGRLCNATSEGTDNCDSMCCGRGYMSYRLQKSEHCQCKYYYCCYVKCKTCWTWVENQVCI